jgi:hypothetical protein
MPRKSLAFAGSLVLGLAGAPAYAEDVAPSVSPKQPDALMSNDDRLQGLRSFGKVQILEQAPSEVKQIQTFVKNGDQNFQVLLGCANVLTDHNDGYQFSQQATVIVAFPGWDLKPSYPAPDENIPPVDRDYPVMGIIFYAKTVYPIVPEQPPEGLRYSAGPPDQQPVKNVQIELLEITEATMPTDSRVARPDFGESKISVTISDDIKRQILKAVNNVCVSDKDGNYYLKKDLLDATAQELTKAAAEIKKQNKWVRWWGIDSPGL